MVPRCASGSNGGANNDLRSINCWRLANAVRRAADRAGSKARILRYREFPSVKGKRTNKVGTLFPEITLLDPFSVAWWEKNVDIDEKMQEPSRQKVLDFPIIENQGTILEDDQNTAGL